MHIFTKTFPSCKSAYVALFDRFEDKNNNIRNKT